MRLSLALLLFSTAPARASVNERIAAIVDHFYNLEFNQAVAGAKELERDFPGHPAGPFYLSVASYQRCLVEEPSSQGSCALFEKDSERALAAARAAGSAEGEYYAGASLGFSARALAARKKYAAALPKARKAVAHLKKALELDPGLSDAKLGLGMFDYFLARVPPAARPFASALVGVWGSRERGLRELREVAASTGPARMEAKSVLAMIFSSEREELWPEGIRLLNELCNRYPGNPLYRLRLAYALEHQGRLDEAARLVDPQGEWIASLAPFLREPVRAAAALRLAEIELLRGSPEQARKTLGALEPAKLPPKLRRAFDRLRDGLPNPPKQPHHTVWPLAGLPSDD